MRITSSRDTVTLDLGDTEPSGHGARIDYLHVQLRGPVSAASRVYDNHFEALASYFRDLAEHWRGWQGTKRWESVESQLTLEASADRAGHIKMRVTLRDDTAGANWSAESTLFLDAGQLDEIADRVAHHLAADRGAA